ncbi:hypothetical protein MDA_GLEAN10018852 [Myotis davidii]|uniref:Uncharacterized protein n=1 Tax=Myotis davidii TaxID=225400 RepID=L5M857_MYODS|nr:hypothetical protein MDA_GLEAN10018852 [Myotis davidii]
MPRPPGRPVLPPQSPGEGEPGPAQLGPPHPPASSSPVTPSFRREVQLPQWQHPGPAPVSATATATATLASPRPGPRLAVPPAGISSLRAPGHGLSHVRERTSGALLSPKDVSSLLLDLIALCTPRSPPGCLCTSVLALRALLEMHIEQQSCSLCAVSVLSPTRSLTQ